MTWPLVPLGDVLKRSGERITLSPADTYREVTVKLWGKGVTLRGQISGSEIASTDRFVVRTNQFIASRIDARNGAFGLIPESLNGAVVTNDFPVFNIAAERLLPEFLGWMSKTAGFVDLCKRASEGTTNRVRLKEDSFLAMAVALPPLAEQRRIVDRVDAVATRLAEARRLREEAFTEAEALQTVQTGRFFADVAERFGTRELKELTKYITDGPHITPTYLPDGVPFVTVQNMVSGTLSFDNLKYISQADHAEFIKRCHPERGDVLYSKDGATRGWPCLVTTDREFSIFVSVALIKPQHDLLDGEYLCHVLKSSRIRERMHRQSRGDMIPHIVLREIRAFPIPFPPLDVQRSLVKTLNARQAQSDAVRALQSETAGELDALLPSVLNQAFAGEL